MLLQPSSLSCSWTWQIFYTTCPSYPTDYPQKERERDSKREPLGLRPALPHYQSWWEPRLLQYYELGYSLTRERWKVRTDLAFRLYFLSVSLGLDGTLCFSVLIWVNSFLMCLPCITSTILLQFFISCSLWVDSSWLALCTSNRPLPVNLLPFFVFFCLSDPHVNHHFVSWWLFLFFVLLCVINSL